MKTRYYLSALGLMLMMAACEKEEQPEAQGVFAPTASDRCGCMAPVEQDAKNATDASIDLIWNSMPEAIAYQVEVASKFDAPDDFLPLYYKEITEGTQLTVSNLSPNTRYEYRISTICANDESSPSAIQTFVTGDFYHGDPPSKMTKLKMANVKTTQ